MPKGQQSTVVILIGGAFLSILNQTLINPALPSIMAELRIGAHAAQWLVSGFTLVNAVVVVVSAFLMDRFTVKKLFIAVFSLFFAGSLLAAWGVNFPVLLAGRVLQAICAGVMLPLSMTVLLLIFPRERRGRAMGIYNFVIMFAPAMGPAISGVLTDKTGWHVMFLIMAVLAAVVILLAAFMPKSAGATRPVSLDRLSLAESSLGLFCLLYGLSLSGSLKTLPAAGGLIVVGLGILVLFVRRQFKLDKPFLELRVLLDARFRFGTVVSMLVSAALTGAAFALPLYIQSIRGFSATISGLVMVPGSVLGAIAGYFAGGLHDRFGARGPAVAGVSLLTVGSLGMVLWGTDTSPLLMIAVFSVRSVGLMFANTPINIWSVSNLSDDILHHGNAVLSAMRQVAATFGVALMVSVMSLTGDVAAAGSGTQMIGIRAAFAFSLFIALVSLILVLVNVRNVPRPVAADPGAGLSELGEAMHTNPYTVSSGDSIGQAVKKFIEYQTSGLPVIDDGGRIIGYVSDGDVLRYLVRQDVYITEELFSLVLPDHEEIVSKSEELLRKNVLEIATRHITTVDTDTPFPEVCRLFHEQKLNKIPVTRDGVLVGTISRGDTMRYLMKRLPLDPQT